MSAQLEEATRMLYGKELELEAKGYPPKLVQLALERARGSAERKSEPIRSAIQLDAFCDILADELDGTELWIEGQQAFLNGET